MKYFIAALLLASCTLGGCGGGMMVRGMNPPAPAAQRSWTCPSCGGSYGNPSNCPKCGTTMVEVATK